MCHIFGQKSLSFYTISVYFFKKQGYRTVLNSQFSISAYASINLQLQILNTFLFLYGFSIVVVINKGLKQYVMNLTKLVHA